MGPIGLMVLGGGCWRSAMPRRGAEHVMVFENAPKLAPDVLRRRMAGIAFGPTCGGGAQTFDRIGRDGFLPARSLSHSRRSGFGRGGRVFLFLGGFAAGPLGPGSLSA